MYIFNNFMFIIHLLLCYIITLLISDLVYTWVFVEAKAYRDNYP